MATIAPGHTFPSLKALCPPSLPGCRGEVMSEGRAQGHLPGWDS